MSPRQQSIDRGEVYNNSSKIIDDHSHEDINTFTHETNQEDTWVQGLAKDVARKSVNTTRFISIMVSVCVSNIYILNKSDVRWI